MSESKSVIILTIDSESETDKEQLKERTYSLREELLNTDVERITFVNNDVIPENTKGIDPELSNTLLITLVSSSSLLTVIISAIKDWLTRNNKPGITLEMNGDKLQITGTTTEKQEELIKIWMRKHVQKD